MAKSLTSKLRGIGAGLALAGLFSLSSGCGYVQDAKDYWTSKTSRSTNSVPAAIKQAENISSIYTGTYNIVVKDGASGKTSMIFQAYKDDKGNLKKVEYCSTNQ